MPIWYGQIYAIELHAPADMDKRWIQKESITPSLGGLA